MGVLLETAMKVFEIQREIEDLQLEKKGLLAEILEVEDSHKTKKAEQLKKDLSSKNDEIELAESNLDRSRSKLREAAIAEAQQQKDGLAKRKKEAEQKRDELTELFVRNVADVILLGLALGFNNFGKFSDFFFPLPYGIENEFFAPADPRRREIRDKIAQELKVAKTERPPFDVSGFEKETRSRTAMFKSVILGKYAESLEARALNAAKREHEKLKLLF